MPRSPKPGAMTVAEAGRRLAAQRGADYMREIGARGGRKGGKELVESRGTDHMRKLSQLAVAIRMPGWNAGGKRSEETREKMRAAQRRRYAQKKPQATY